MKMHKFISETFPKIVILAMMTAISLTSLAQSDDNKPEKTLFLQDIQDQLVHVSGIKNRNITIHIIDDKKRKTILTPSSISLSYGFLKQMKDINQLVSTLAHLTAHISLDFVATPPLPEDNHDGQEKSSVTGYLKSTIRPQYPDENNMPQATGAFHKKGAEILERPRYHNKDYEYSVNKTDIIKAEHELEVDKITDKILRHSGYCPADYSRMLYYFYENPQLMLGNKHFALDADQWQRIDAVNRRADPGTACDKAQIALTQKHAGDFDQLLVRVMLALRK